MSHRFIYKRRRQRVFTACWQLDRLLVAWCQHCTRWHAYNNREKFGWRRLYCETLSERDQSDGWFLLPPHGPAPAWLIYDIGQERPHGPRRAKEDWAEEFYSPIRLIRAWRASVGR